MKRIVFILASFGCVIASPLHADDPRIPKMLMPGFSVRELPIDDHVEERAAVGEHEIVAESVALHFVDERCELLVV